MALTIEPGTLDAGWTTCRCCGGEVPAFLAPIHTACISKHWGKHSHGINASRCKEFGAKS